MLEIVGDIWGIPDTEVICIPTNGTVNKYNNAIMGKGLALDCKTRYPSTPEELGWQIRINGNKIFHLITTNLNGKSTEIWSFPVKHNWQDKTADIKLIKQSAEQLVKHSVDYKKILLPRIGCGAGKLNWEKEVKPVLSLILTENKFYIVEKKGN